MFFLGILAVIPLVLLLFYIRLNDRGLTRLPADALAFSPNRYTQKGVRETADRISQSPISIIDQLPPKTGRRYIVVGGVNSKVTFVCGKLED
jgi:hypothetical protein